MFLDFEKKLKLKKSGLINYSYIWFMLSKSSPVRPTTIIKSLKP